MENFFIGPSTGWLYAAGISSLKDQEEILRGAQVNAFEFVMDSWDKTNKRTASLGKGNGFSTNTFVYRSLHLPSMANRSREAQCVLAKETTSRLKATVAIVHPLKIRGIYPFKYYEDMVLTGVPLALENMDSRKDSGFSIDELCRIVTHMNLRFVLDVQHAYEHGHAMDYAKDLFLALKNRIVHLHVSGQTTTCIHALVHRADNATQIIEFLGYIFSQIKVPIILEGEYHTAQELKAEVEFISKELGLQ